MIAVSNSTRQMRYLLKWLLLCLAFFLCTLAGAQSPQEKLKGNLKNYIRTYSDEAVNQMIEYKIPASVILAQAIFESGSGTSDLAVKSKNHFGIKCHLEWEGDTITKTDDTLNECFRKYYDVQDSYTDHSLFLVTRQRYAFLFELPISDYQSWCYGLKNAGYATYPTYAEDLIKLIEDEKLYELDRVPMLQSRAFANLVKAPEPPMRAIAPIITPSLKDLCKDGLIWLDEQDVLIQSLDMLVDGSDDAPVLAAD